MLLLDVHPALARHRGRRRGRRQDPAAEHDHPRAARATYTTQEDRQTGFEIHVLQGEREMVADNRSLARFTLQGHPADGRRAWRARGDVPRRRRRPARRPRARELTTGVEQTVMVKPSYGLDDAAVEQMLMDALDHGEDDLRAAPARGEPRRGAPVPHRDGQGLATRIGAADARRAASRSTSAMRALEEAARGEDPAKIHARIEALDDASQRVRGAPDEPRDRARDRRAGKVDDVEARRGAAVAGRALGARDGHRPLQGFRRGRGSAGYFDPQGRADDRRARGVRLRRRVRLLDVPRLRAQGRASSSPSKRTKRPTSSTRPSTCARRRGSGVSRRS